MGCGNISRRNAVIIPYRGDIGRICYRERFGYRAKFISRASNSLVARAHREGGTAEEWLLVMLENNRKEVEKELTEFRGIGQKVAGCVALMSLDKYSNVPADVDVVDLASPNMRNLKAKSITKRVYEQVGDHLRNK